MYQPALPMLGLPGEHILHRLTLGQPAVMKAYCRIARRCEESSSLRMRGS